MDSVTNTLTGGFPHSEIHGSKLALNSPCLIAECHVLHRLIAPRHPPNALARRLILQFSRPSRRSASLPHTGREPRGQERHVPAKDGIRESVSPARAGPTKRWDRHLHDFERPTSRAEPTACQDKPEQAESLNLAEGFLVEADGIEPTTSCLQSRRSPN